MTQENNGFTHQDGVSLKEHFENHLQSMKELFTSRLEALEKAIDVATGIQHERNVAQNEWRGTVTDLTNTFVPAKEYKLMNETMRGDIQSLKESRAELSGKASQVSVDIAYVIAIIGVLIGIAGLLT